MVKEHVCVFHFESSDWLTLILSGWLRCVIGQESSSRWCLQRANQTLHIPNLNSSESMIDNGAALVSCHGLSTVVSPLGDHSMARVHPEMTGEVFSCIPS